MNMARVEVFGLVRPGQVYEMAPEKLPEFVEDLRRRDADFFEVLDDGLVGCTVTGCRARFFYVPARAHPNLCIDHAADAVPS